MRRKNLLNRVLAVVISTSMALSSFTYVYAADTIDADIATTEDIQETSESQADVIAETQDGGTFNSEGTTEGTSEITGEGTTSGETIEAIPSVPETETTGGFESNSTEGDSSSDSDGSNQGSENNQGENLITPTPSQVEGSTKGTEGLVTPTPEQTESDTDGTEELVTPTPEPEETLNELESVSNNFKIKVSRKDGQGFPKGTYLNLYTLDDMLGEEADSEELKKEYLDLLVGEASKKYVEKYIEGHQDIEWTDDLVESLNKEYRKVFKSFDIFQFDILNEDTSLYDTEGVDFNVIFEVTDSSLLSSLRDGTEWVDLIPYNEQFEAMPLKEDKLSVGGDDEKGIVVASLDAGNLSPFYAFSRIDLTWEFNPDEVVGDKLTVKVGDVDVACTCSLSEESSTLSDEEKKNPWKHYWDCDIFKAQVEESCTCEHKDEGIDVLYHTWGCTSLTETLKNKCDCGHGYREEDLDFYVSLHSDECEISKHYYSTPIASYAATNVEWHNEGIKLKGNVGDVKEGYLLTGDFTNFTGNGYYNHIRWYNGQTSISGWISDGTNVKMKDTGTFLAFVTNNTEAAGKFGYTLNHISINNGRWVNAKVTVTNVAANMYSKNDTRVVKYYPVIAIQKSAMGGGSAILFKSSGARLGLKFDLYYDDGSTATGNYALSLTGVNAGQNFGVSAAGLAHKYSLYNNIVYAKSCTPFKNNPGEVICAVQASKDGESNDAYLACKQGQTYYQYNNISSFKYAIGCAGNPLDSSQQGRRATYSKLKEQAAYAIKAFNDPSLITDSYIGSKISSWLSGYAWGASDPFVEKHVSTTLFDVSSTNINLSSPGQAFYYNFKVGVQGVPSVSYGFSSFNIQDAIPAGVTCTGAKVVRISDWADVTGSFSYSNNSGMVTVSATSSALESTAFYDETYIISLICNGNPETVPSSWISYSGNNYSYSIDNAAFLNVVFKQAGGGPLNKSYDSGIARINYSGTKKRITAEKFIWDEENNGNWIKSKDLAKSGDITYLIQVNVPSNDYMALLDTFTLEDTLPQGVTYKGGGVTVYGNWPDDASSKFNITATGNKITITGKPEHLNTYAFHGKNYLFMFKCKVDTTAVNPNRISGNTYYYTFSNNATITTKHKGDSSNTVTTTNSVPVNVTATRTNPVAPVKYIMDGNTKAYSKTTKNISETYTYRIEQKIPDYDPIWYVSSMNMSDTLENCFDFVDVKVYFNDTLYATLNKTNTSYGGVALSMSGQTVTVTTNGFNPERYGGSINYVMNVKIKNNADLSKWVNSNGKSCNT